MLSNRARLIVKTVVLTLLGAGTIAAIIGLIVFRAGLYNIAANEQHYPLIYTVFEEGLQYSIQNHAEDIQVPALGAPAQLLRGAAVYRANCVQCHGAPGIAPLSQGMSMQPMPGPLVDADVNWETRELYWITRNGIKMSGMPAWEYHLSDSDIWAVVAFVAAMPGMTPADYRRMTTQQHLTEPAQAAARTAAEGEDS